MAAPSGSTPKLLLPYPIDDDNVDVPRDIKALADKLDGTLVPAGNIPVGGLLMWPIALAPDANWLVCNGGSVPAAGYPALDAILGHDGGGNIVLPNLQGRFPLGTSGTHPLKEAAGEETHILLAAESGQRAHKHTLTDPGHFHTYPAAPTTLGASGAPGGTLIVGSSTANATASKTTGITMADSPVLNGAPHNNMPPFFVVNFIIRAK